MNLQEVLRVRFGVDTQRRKRLWNLDEPIYITVAARIGDSASQVGNKSRYSLAAIAAL